MLLFLNKLCFDEIFFFGTVTFGKKEYNYFGKRYKQQSKLYSGIEGNNLKL